jgi:uncharacterized membrane protein YjjP (DUF1212 family)
METKNKLKEIQSMVDTYNSKLVFSVISFLFFTALFTYTLFVDMIPTFVPYIFLGVAIVFIQQIIRSYNYKRFYEISYNANKMIDEMFDK